MQEYEVNVTDFDVMQRVLEGIGMQAVKESEKKRVSYLLGRVHFDIDTLSEIPTFLEVEAPDINSLEHHVQLLGYTMKDAKPWTGKDVLQYYQKKF